MKKISITKKDSVPRIVEKILESGENEIVLSVSPNSTIKESFSNFELIKREAKTAGKNVLIDSRDAEISEMAERAGMFGGQTPIKKAEGRLISDIVPMKRGAAEKEAEEEIREEKPSRHIKIETKKTSGSFWSKAEEESEEKKQFIAKIDELPPPESHEHKKKIHHPRRRKVLVYIAGIFVFGIAVCWAVGALWGKAGVSLSFKKIPWQYNGTVLISKTFSRVDVSKNYLPAEIFKQQKNTSRIFPASGTSDVSQKATARIVIYNAYNSSSQKLVATTRFAAPDGKIFRLDSSVVIPGASSKDGKIVPSSIEASITADKPGAEYNIGPLDKMTIPGFKGTPRYQGFYATMPQPASGGMMGQTKVPTEQDIASAKEKTTQGLKDTLQSGFLNSRPQGFNILDGASLVTITKLVPGKTANTDGNFSIFGEASFQALGFKDDDLNSLVSSLMHKDYPDMDFTNLKIDYKNVKTDFIAGQMTFSLVVDGIIEPKFSESELKSKIAGKSLNEARETLKGLSDLDNGKISLWPFWLTGLPKNTNRINIIWN